MVEKRPPPPVRHVPPPRKPFLLRLPPDLHAALEKWAGDELRSVNAQIEFLLADATRKAGRWPRTTRR